MPELDAQVAHHAVESVAVVEVRTRAQSIGEEQDVAPRIHRDRLPGLAVGNARADMPRVLVVAVDGGVHRGPRKVSVVALGRMFAVMARAVEAVAAVEVSAADEEPEAIPALRARARETVAQSHCHQFLALRRAALGVDAPADAVGVRVGVHRQADADLAHVGCAAHPLRGLARRAQRRQQDAAQDGDHAHADDQFDDGESGPKAGARGRSAR